MNNKIILSLVLGLFLIGFVLATSVGIDNSDFTKGKVIYKSPSIVNYSLIATVNSSDFWDSLNSPSDIDHSLLDNLAWSVAGHTWDENINFGVYNLTAGTYFGDGSQLTGVSGIWEDIGGVATYGGDTNVTGDIYSNNYQVLSYKRTVNSLNVTMTAVI